MNAQERSVLSQFLQQLDGVKLTEKNGEAETMIRDAVARQPDAAYLLVQKCLLQDQALQTAQTQIADLQRQLQQKNAASTGSGFLHNNPWAASAQDNGVPGASGYRVPSAPDHGNVSRAAPQPQGGSGFGSGAGSSFLGSVATTAAGVVAGSFLFQGIENLMGHHASSSMWSQANPEEQLGEQTIINNYYGDQDQLADNGMNGDDLYASDDNNGDDSFLDDGGDFDSDWG